MSKEVKRYVATRTLPAASEWNSSTVPHTYVRAADYDALLAENERLRMQLVACGVVALANTPESAAEARVMHPDYMSASCQDVMRAVDSEMALLAERDALKKDVERARMRVKELDLLVGRYLLGMRSAVIEMEYGRGARAGMQWIVNGLAGPGEFAPDEEDDAQAYFKREIKAVDAGMNEVMAYYRAERPSQEKL